jgi:hypothetical protein
MNLKFPLLLITVSVVLFSCEKKTPKEVEEAIKYETDAIETNICNADKFIFTAKLLSKMPSNGIKLTVTAKEEVSGSNLGQDEPIVSKGTQTAMNVKGLPKQKWVVATIKVCSAKDSTNCVSKSFRVVYK